MFELHDGMILEVQYEGKVDYAIVIGRWAVYQNGGHDDANYLMNSENNYIRRIYEPNIPDFEYCCDNNVVWENPNYFA